MHPADRAALDQVVCALHSECQRLRLDCELSIREDGRVEVRFIRHRDGCTRILIRAFAFDPSLPDLPALSREILKIEGEVADG